MAEAVVLAQGTSGLEAGACLSKAGHSVRVLGMSGGQLSPIHPDVVEYGSAHFHEQSCAGPAFRTSNGPEWLFEAGELRSAFRPRSKAGKSFRAWLRHWGEVRVNADSWLRDRASDGETALAIVRTSTGVEYGLPSLAVVRRHFGVERCWYAGDAWGWRRQRVSNGHGDVVDEVDLYNVEIAGGRVRSVETDVGREWVDDSLFIDMPLARLISALPNSLQSALRTAVRRVPTVHHVQAIINVNYASIPDLVMVNDPSGVWRVRVVRGRDGGPRSLVCDVTLRAVHSASDEARERLARFIPALGRRVDAFGEPALLIREYDAGGEHFVAVLTALNRIGIFHVDQAATWLAGRRPAA